MSIYRPKGTKVWVMDFMFHGQRIRETTGMTSKTRAREVHDKRKQGLRDGTAGIRPQARPHLFSTAANQFLESRVMARPAKSTEANSENDEMEEEDRKEKNRQARFRYLLLHLLPAFGKKLLVDIEAENISNYQKMRLAQGAANATVNREIEFLRQIMRKNGAWARIAANVKMLPERLDVGRAVTAEEESTLLRECAQSQSRLLLPFVVLSLETGARFNTIRRLRWENIDFSQRRVQFGKDKTRAGTGRVIPLNRHAIQALLSLARQSPSRKPRDFVFPSEKYCGRIRNSNSGIEDLIVVDPTRPLGNPRTAWAAAKNRTRRHCPTCKDGTLIDQAKPSAGYVCVACGFQTENLPRALLGVRLHDLRHSAVSRMVAAGVPLPMIGKIVGWSPSTLALMTARYGHFGVEELRNAVETISGRNGVSQWAPRNAPPELDDLQECEQKSTFKEDGHERTSLAARTVRIIERPGLPYGKSALMKRYDRKDLYEKVWTTPIRTLAREFGVSDVTLGKACKGLRIPIPGRGYWAKKRANLPVRDRPPLQPL